MRASRLPYVWLLWGSLLSLLVWWIAAPAGYLAYSKQWLLHLRYSEIWPGDQRSVSDNVVGPALADWAAHIDETLSSQQNLATFHALGTPLSSPEWKHLEARYAARGIQVIDGPTYAGAESDAAVKQLATIAARPAALRSLYEQIEQRLQSCASPACAQGPHVAWIYIALTSGLTIHWPGGNQGARYLSDVSPSLENSGRTGQPWLETVLDLHSFFDPLGGDTWGFGDVMTTMRPITVDGAKGVIAADVYWEKGPLTAIRWQVLAYSFWAVASALLAVAALAGIGGTRLSMLRDGDGVCVTIDIVGWSQIEDVRERFKRQWTLDSIVASAFFASTKQRLVRWSTGDGYHVLFMDHWGAKMYSEVLLFIRNLLASWEARLQPDPTMRGATLRISVGSHGSVRMRRRHGEWIAIGDRIVSAVRIDEVSKKMRNPEINRRTIAIEQSFKNEIKLTVRGHYEAAVAGETGPFTETDKSGKSHQFSLLDMTVNEAAVTTTLWEKLFARLRARPLPAKPPPGKSEDVGAAPTR